MNKHKYIYLTAVLSVLLMTTACGNQTNSGTANPVNTVPAETDQPTTAPAATTAPAVTAAPAATASPENNTTNPENTTGPDKAANADTEILIIIDQTAKPSEGNSFDFGVKKLPEGFALAEMQWISKENLVVNSVQEAIAHGANGEDGFYISGNGQYTGFIYSDALKGEEGQVVFLFKDAAGKELTWKKKITLK